MIAYNFMPRFANLIASGTKSQAIRKHRRRPARHANRGEIIRLCISSRPPASEFIREARCLEVLPIRMRLGPLGIREIMIAGRPFDPARWAEFARRDGFRDFADMSAWWLDMHGPGRFDGAIIRWEPI